MYELVQAAPRTHYIQSPAKVGVVELGAGDVCLIDSGSDKDAGRKARKILDARAWHLRAIYNTHSNADHIGGNRYLQQQTGCKIYAPGIERDFTRHTVLEPSFLFGGFPPEELKRKFLLAQESDAEELTEEILPEGFSMIPLPGHFFDMIPMNKIERSKIMKKIFLCLFLMLIFVGVFADEFSEKFQNKKWILEYYNEIIYKRDRNLLLNYIPKYRNQKETLFQRTSLLDECDYWCDTNSDSSIIYLLFDSFEIRDIKQISENCFYLFIGNGFIDTEKYNKNLENGCDWRNKEIKIESFYFKFDGDYLYIFLNDINNLLTTYCAYDNNEYAVLIRFLQTNNFSNNIISLPRHADGSCDYGTKTRQFL